VSQLVFNGGGSGEVRWSRYLVEVEVDGFEVAVEVDGGGRGRRYCGLRLEVDRLCLL